MRLLLLGANGQLGQELNHRLSSVGEVKACRRSDVDLTDHHSIIAAIDAFSPDVIVNAAAYTAVDKAETEPELAFKINADAVGVLANEADKHNIWLIHYSTEYVFDGTATTFYSETDATNPINIYGKSKLAGERAITENGCKHLIFRTTWIIGQYGRHNFAKTILRLAKEHSSLNIVNDQFGVPTTPALIAKVTATAIKDIATSNAWPSGIYHLAPRGQTTWHEIAQTLIHLANEEQLNITVDKRSVHPIKTTDYPTAAKRPPNSLLNTNRLEQYIKFNLPHWEDDFSIVAKEIIKDLRSL